MAEIYTKPFESVQAAITLFEQKIYPTKCSNKEEKGGFLKDLTDSNLLLEADEHEKNLAFFEFDASSKSPDELLTLLKLYRAERDNYKEKFRRSQALFLEYEKGEHSEAEMMMMKKKLTVEIIMKKPSSSFCAVMEEDLNVPEAGVLQSQRRLEVLRNLLDEMEYLENELLKQIVISEYLHVELKQSKEEQVIFSKAVSSAMNELDLVKSENELMKQVISENKNYILEIEVEGKRMKEELAVSSEKINGINGQIEMLVGRIQMMQEEMSMSKNMELEFQPNVTALPSELNNSSNPPAAKESEEARSMSARAGLNQAMQQLAVEAEEVKTRVQRPTECNKATAETDGTESIKNSSFIDADSNGFCAGITISMEEYEFLLQQSDLADRTKSEPTDEHEVYKLKGELEDRYAEISELKCILEETERRASLAEKAKLSVESQLRRWRDQLQLRRSTSEAVKEFCAVKDEAGRQHEKPFFSKMACINPVLHGIPSLPKRTASMREGRKLKNIPLGKLLKIKF